MSPSSHERQITDRAFAACGHQPTPRLESNALINLAFLVTQAELGTVVPKYFMQAIGTVSNTRLLLLTSPQVAVSVGLVYLPGNPMMPMTKAVVELVEASLASGELSRELEQL